MVQKRATHQYLRATLEDPGRTLWLMRILLAPCLAFMIACGSSVESSIEEDPQGGSAGDGGGSPSTGGASGSGGASASGGSSGSGGASASGGSGGGGSTGGSSNGRAGASGGAGALGSGGGTPEDPNATGVWVNVTPPGDYGDYGLGHVVADPQNASDLYISGGARGTWKSSDYGRTWSKINNTGGYYNIAIANDKPGPPTLWVDIGNDGLLAEIDRRGRDLEQRRLHGNRSSALLDGGRSLFAGSRDLGYARILGHRRVDQRRYDLPQSDIARRHDGGCELLSILHRHRKRSDDRPWLARQSRRGPAVLGSRTMRARPGPRSTTGFTVTAAREIFQSGPAGAVFMAVVGGDNGDGVYRSSDLGATWTKVDGTKQPRRSPGAHPKRFTRCGVGLLDRTETSLRHSSPRCSRRPPAGR